tara:strand:- start:237 stop:338 length:102 start_codon:yes stop_codon:yes gene_type:complete
VAKIKKIIDAMEGFKKSSFSIYKYPTAKKVSVY